MSPQPRSIAPDRGTSVPAVPAWLQAALLLCALVVVAGPAQAQPVLRYRVNQRGDFTAVGNVLGHDCRSSAPAVPAPVVGTVSNCGFTLNDTAMDVFWRTDGTAAGTVANQTVAMTEASSQAMLVLPAGAQITYARLYWAASREYNYAGGPMVPDTTVTLSRVGPGGFTEDLNADLTWYSTRWPAQYDYQGSADVTRLIGQYGSGAYRLSGVSVWPTISQFSDTSFAAWWLVVFYRLPNDPVRTLALYDDLLGLQSQNTQITLGGFIIPRGVIDAKMGVVVYEGDIGDVGETFTLNGQTLADANNPSNNFFNGTKSYLGSPVSQAGDLPQHLGTPHSVTGLDLDVTDVTLYFSADQTSAVARVVATSDIFWLSGFPTSITTLAPDFTNTVKTFRAVNPRPDGSVRAGDILEYTIRTTNQGNESSLNTVLTDPLPQQLQYVPGTLAIASGPNTGAKTDAAGDDQGEYDAATRTIIVRLGTNANATTGGIIEVNESTSITFQARVVPGPASTINNQAYIRARGATNPTQSTTPSTPTDGGPSGPTPTPIGLPAPVVTSPAEGSTVPDRQPTFVGTSVPGTTVDVIIGGVVVCTATTNAAGNWSCQSVPPLANGNYQLLAIARDSQGNVSEPTRVNFLVSGSAPQAPVINTPAEGSSTSNTRPPISGTAEPGNTVTVTEGGTTLCTAVANASGNWTCTPATALTEGPHTIQAVQRRSNGTTSPPSANRNFTVDNTAPGAPIIVSPVEGSHHLSSGLSIVGLGEPGSTVTVTEGSTTLCTALVSASGRWSCQPSPALAVGAHAITARAVDAAGNTGPSSPVRNFTVVSSNSLAAPVINVPAESSTTGDTTPLFSGTAPLNSTVTVWVDGVQVCTATASAVAPGNWSCESTVVLAHGLHMAVAVAQSGANISPTSEPRTFNVDALAPVAPVIVTPLEGSVTTNTRQPISGTAEGGSTVTVRDNGGNTICTVVVPLSGNWSCTPTADLPEGLNRVTAVARDAFGNTGPASPVRSFTVDTSAPSAPVITAPGEGSTTGNRRIPIAGTAEAGSTVTVRDNGGNTICTATADASGNWTCTPAADLPAGLNRITAVARDAAGNTSSPSAVRSFTVATSLPAPVISAPAEGSVTRNNRPSISGTAEPGATVTVSEDGTTLCTATADANGDWNCTPATALADRLHTISAIQQKDGLTSPASPDRTFRVDTTAPGIPVIATPTEGSSTNNQRVPITGTAEANSTVTVTEGGITVCSAAADAAGRWSCTPLSDLVEGPHAIIATATDAAGNTSQPTPVRNFTVDITAPAAPVITTPTEGSSTNNRRVPITGTAEANATVTVRDSGGNTICTATADASGAWNCTPTADLPLGANQIIAAARDAAGNDSPATPVRNFTVDTTAPAAPVITAPAEGGRTNDTTPVFTGTAEAGSTVTVTVGGVTVCTAVADASGNWSCESTVTLQPDGPRTAIAVARDAAGNTSPDSAPRNFIVDTAAPAAPVITTPAEGSRTRSTTPAITGTAEPGSTVTVTEGGATLCTAVTDASGNWSCTPAASLNAGPHAIVAVARDAAGNTSPATPVRNFVVDTTAPAAPAIDTPTEGSTTNNNRPPISGTAEANSIVTVREGSTTLCTAVTNASGNWSCTPTNPLTRGPHAIVATATDEAGNESPASPVRNFTVDTSTIAAPIINTPAEGSTTSNSRPSISGTAEPGATVTVTEGGTTLCTTTADASGNWNCVPATALADGPHAIVATASNAQGSSPASPVRNFTVDTSAPATPVLTAPTEGSRTPDSTPTFTGRGDPGSTVTVAVDGATVCTALVDASGAWSCTPTNPLPDGPRQAVAIARDQAGNESPATPVRNFIVDTTAPAAPVITTPAEGSRTRNTTPAITGTAEPGSTVTVTEGGATLCTAVTDASGNWSCTPAASLTVGPHAIVATATDAVGNTSPTTPVRNFTIFMDSDGDGIPDDREPPGDTDGDGTPDANDPDSDNDGIPDGVEDRDQDGEVDPGESNPRGSDSDNDGIPDGVEDRDRDGTVDEGETSPTIPDSDNDGIPDGVEDRNRNGLVDDGELDPRNPDVDGDGLKDGEEDKNRNGTRDSDETDPFDADTDDGGAKDGEEASGGTNPINGDDDYVFAGFGCTSAGATPLLLPLALLLAVPRRRRQASAPSPRSTLTGGLLLALLAVFAASPARAQGIDIQQYKPGPGVNDVLGVYGPKVGPHLGLHGGLSLNYARDPLGVLDPRTGAFVSRIVTDQFTADVLASVSLFDRFELGLALPITFQGGPPADGANAFFGGTGAGAGMGDLRLVPKALLLSTDSGLDVGIALPLSLPTAASQRFLGAGGVSVMPMVTAQWANSGLRVLANAGVRIQPEVQLRNLRVGNELAYALGAEVPVSEPLSVRASLEGALALNTASAQQVPLELLAAARYVLQEGLALQVGGGPGLTRGYGTPAFRLFASVGWTPPAPPPAPRATCAEGPEDLDGFQDEDGCVDPDNDQDGIADAPDICPNEAEVKNGYRDEDGCPDVALDDKAPAPAIAYAGDTDGDGLNDDQDRCAKQAEDKDSFEDFDGCPEPDNDKDGLADADDKCPLEAETINGNQDEDGCPDEGRSKVRLDKDRIVILDKVYFATGKDIILERSFSLLEQVASVLRANPQIQLVRIEGHTDDQGADAKNLDLSQRRANGVRRYLIDTGIAPERLEAVGYGETRPTDTNKTAAGRENNRRVEFNIVKMAGSPAGGEEP